MKIKKNTQILTVIILPIFIDSLVYCSETILFWYLFDCKCSRCQFQDIEETLFVAR